MARGVINRFGFLAGVALTGVCAGALSQPVDAMRVTLERADHDTHVGAVHDGRGVPDVGADALNLRLWAQSGKTSFTVGQAYASGQAGAWLLGVHRQLGEGSRLSLEQAWWRAGADDVSGVAGPARSDVRVGFEFKPTNALTRYGVSRESLLRFQLSGSWSVSMRPRSGGIALALRASL